MNSLYQNTVRNLMLLPTSSGEAENKHPLMRYPQYNGHPANNMHPEAINRLSAFSRHGHSMNVPVQPHTNPYVFNVGQGAPLLFRVGGLSSHPSSQLANRMLKGNHSSCATPPDYSCIVPQREVDCDMNNHKRNGYMGSMQVLDNSVGTAAVVGVGAGPRVGARPQRTVDWEHRLQMLVEFKNKHGHCMVPQSHPQLGAWVKWQREKYALFENGKVSYFTPEKIASLNKLGFVWRVRRKRKKSYNKNDSETESQSKAASSKKTKRDDRSVETSETSTSTSTSEAVESEEVSTRVIKRSKDVLDSVMKEEKTLISRESTTTGVSSKDPHEFEKAKRRHSASLQATENK